MRIPKCEQWDLVEVHWMDSRGSDEGWHKIKKREMEIHGCITVGQVYAQSSDRLCIILSRDSVENQADSSITIPAIAITQFYKLKRIAR